MIKLKNLLLEDNQPYYFKNVGKPSEINLDELECDIVNFLDKHSNMAHSVKEIMSGVGLKGWTRSAVDKVLKKLEKSGVVDKNVKDEYDVVHTRGYFGGHTACKRKRGYYKYKGK